MRSMNPSMVSKIVSIVPDRTPRLRSGTPFAPAAAVSTHASQIAYLAQFLNWLTPLNAINEEDQRALGCLPPHGRPTRPDDEDEVDNDREEHLT
jgi:hypothetical protein